MRFLDVFLFVNACYLSVNALTKFRPKTRPQRISTKFDVILQAIGNQSFSFDLGKNGDFIKPGTITKLATKSYVSDGGMARSIDPTLHPCDDFYEYVCSGWIKENPLSDYDVTETQNAQVDAQVLIQYILLFSKASIFRNNRERLLMLNYVGNCANKNSTKNIGTSLFFSERRKLRKNGDSITDLMINDYPTAYFIDLGVIPDDYNSTNNILVIKPSSSLLSWMEYTAIEYRNQYEISVKFLKKIHTLLANDDLNHEVFANNSTEVDRRVGNILRIDRQIAQILNSFSPPNTTNRNLPLNQLSSFINQIDYLRYWNTVLPTNIVKQKDFNKTLVQVMNDGAVRQINEVLKRVDSQAISDYLDYQLISEVISGLDDRAMKLYKDYESSVFGIRQRDSSQSEAVNLITCIQTATTIFSDIASAMYIEHYFPQQSKDEVEMMVEKLKESFLEMLSEETWIDEKTKEQAREKALAMRQFVGYNPDIFNQTAISIKYSTLDIPQNLSSWEVDVRVGKWLADNAYQTLFEKNVLGDFEFLASDVNAYYLPSQNTIAILAGILQSPYFNATQSRSQNFGGIGTIIGHEITHGFDDYGSQFDANGNKRNWWNKATFSNFQTKTQCFVGEYGVQKVENLTLRVDGYKTLGENIADNGGFRAALKAFQKLLRTNQGGSRPSAPELQKYTPLQIFFMSYAYNWCAISRPSYLLDSVPEDSHSPNRIRVNTVISNQPEFEQLFNCPKNSKMLDNPKCTLW